MNQGTHIGVRHAGNCRVIEQRVKFSRWVPPFLPASRNIVLLHCFRVAAIEHVRILVVLVVEFHKLLLNVWGVFSHGDLPFSWAYDAHFSHVGRVRLGVFLTARIALPNGFESDHSFRGILLNAHVLLVLCDCIFNIVKKRDLAIF